MRSIRLLSLALPALLVTASPTWADHQAEKRVAIAKLDAQMDHEVRRLKSKFDYEILRARNHSRGAAKPKRHFAAAKARIDKWFADGQARLRNWYRVKRAEIDARYAPRRRVSVRDRRDDRRVIDRDRDHRAHDRRKARRVKNERRFRAALRRAEIRRNRRLHEARRIYVANLEDVRCAYRGRRLRRAERRLAYEYEADRSAILADFRSERARILNRHRGHGHRI